MKKITSGASVNKVIVAGEGGFPCKTYNFTGAIYKNLDTGAINFTGHNGANILLNEYYSIESVETVIGVFKAFLKYFVIASLRNMPKR